MSVTITTKYGKVEGEQSNGLSIFRGIPFAAPPVGALRWLPPTKPQAWSGVRDARKFSAIPPQNPVPISLTGAAQEKEEQSEDCLYLNVWTPAADNKRRPVMVWIYGGGFVIGSSSSPNYDGSVLARRGDTVVVSMNYRLGPLGFLRLNEVTNGKIPNTGSEGLLDMIAALEWVRDNVAEFGGDPNNVTIFGESAGGMAVGCLLGAPPARGLFQRAIAQSGACHTGASVEIANKSTENILGQLKVKASDADAIRALTAHQLLKDVRVNDGVANVAGLPIPYQPVCDAKVMPRLAFETVAQGNAAGVAVMAGATLEEWKLFVAADASLANLDSKGLHDRIGVRLGADSAAKVIDIYEKARKARGEDASPREIYCAINSDRMFRMPGVRLSEIQSRRKEPHIYNYIFDWRSPVPILGACHALDFPFEFGTYKLPGMENFVGSGPKADKLATQVQDSWLAFARTGNPSCESLGDWPRYDETKRATIMLGENTRVENAPREEERHAWDVIKDIWVGVLGGG